MYPSTQTLAHFRRRIALTNPHAPWHYMALARAERGQDPLKDAASRNYGDERRCAPSTATLQGFAESAPYGWQRWQTLEWAAHR